MEQFLTFHAGADTGETTGKASFSPDCGVLRIRADLPSGILRDAVAELPWAMVETERLFMNGYQTWTHCPELKKQDRLKGLDGVPSLIRRHYGLDRYGDYFFVPYSGKKGQSHGFSYCYFRKGDTYRLIGSLDETPGYTIFAYDSQTEKLTVRRDCAGVRHPGGKFAAFDLFFAQGGETEVFDAWFAAMGCKARPVPKLAGYSSWYNRYQNINAASVEEDLRGYREVLPKGSLFQIDDGWEPFVGDWLETAPQKFPQGLAPFVEQSHGAGLLAGLWLAPFVCETKSRLYAEHPDWLLRIDGKPWRCGCNWSGFYALDIDNPEVQAYLEGVFRRVFEQWRFDLVKLDFLYAVAPFGNARESRAARMGRAMKLLRKWCGEKLILGCGVPLMPCFGVVDYCRIGCDVSLDWDDQWFMRLLHRERVSTRQSIDNTIFRRQLNGRAFGNDPDVFLLREDNCKLTPEEKNRLSTANALFGSILLCSDNPARYSPETRAQYEQVQRLFTKARNPEVQADRGLKISCCLDGSTVTQIIHEEK